MRHEQLDHETHIGLQIGVGRRETSVSHEGERVVVRGCNFFKIRFHVGSIWRLVGKVRGGVHWRLYTRCHFGLVCQIGAFGRREALFHSGSVPWQGGRKRKRKYRTDLHNFIRSAFARVTFVVNTLPLSDDHARILPCPTSLDQLAVNAHLSGDA